MKGFCLRGAGHRQDLQCWHLAHVSDPGHIPAVASDLPGRWPAGFTYVHIQCALVAGCKSERRRWNDSIVFLPLCTLLSPLFLSPSAPAKSPELAASPLCSYVAGVSRRCRKDVAHSSELHVQVIALTTPGQGCCSQAPFCLTTLTLTPQSLSVRHCFFSVLDVTYGLVAPKGKSCRRLEQRRCEFYRRRWLLYFL